MSWQSLNIDTSKGTGKTLCPKCSSTRTKKDEPCLSIDLENGLFCCHHCGWGGSVNGRHFAIPDDKGHELTSKMLEYFKSRGISEETTKKAKVTCGSNFIANSTKDTIHFNYYRNGILINIKYRDNKKNFMLFKGAELIPYNYDAIKISNEIIIVEGEFDALSFIEAGYDFVISVPNGANTKNLDFLPDIVDKQKIYLCVDKDEAGQKLEAELVRRLGKDKCWIINFPFKDANECLVKAGVQELQWAFKDAKQLPLDDIIYLNQVEKDLLSQFDKGREHGTTTYLKSLDEHFTWKKGMVNLWHGIGNRGKSTFVYYLALLQSINKHTKWGIFTPEQFPAYDFYDALIQSYLGQNTDLEYPDQCSKSDYKRGMEFIKEHFYFIHPFKNSPTPEFINNKFRELILRHGIEGCITDPFNQLDNDISKFGRDDLYISDFLSNEKRFAQEFNVYKNIVAHPKTMRKEGNKTYECPDVYDLHGGSMWNNKCDNITAIHAPDWGTDRASTKRLIAVQKIRHQRLVGIPGDTYLEYNRTTGRFYESSN